ncbi:MAG TPA: hypothetical protein VE058_06110 [Steroidobacteraceae bacterium]|nr:hypothetical protein [Steroidobacteraceae bacterium]
MIQSQFTRLLITATLVAITVPIYAQQAPEPAKAPANSNPAAPAQADTSAQDADAAAAAAAIAKAKAAAAAQAEPKPKSSSDGDAALAKRAKEAGWRAEVRSGVTVYCRQDAVVGSRFTQKRCAAESQLAGILERQEYEREQLKQRGCGGNCGGK